MISNNNTGAEAVAAAALSIEVLKRGAEAKPGWWVALSAGERSVIREVAKILRQAKKSESPEMARAGAKWERVLGCFIKVRLQGERQKAEARGRRLDCRRCVAPVRG